MPKKSAYAAAGVDIDEKAQAFALMSQAVRSTYGPEVLAGMGSFGGLYDVSRLKGMRAPVLVASTDGVGTKTMISSALSSYETIGYDIVNHCINDILVQNAEPLFFLDYLATPAIEKQMVARIVTGIASACREAGCALLGGETAEMPGVYAPGQFDVAGTIIGLVERDALITGASCCPGDILLGLPSSGLHTNGYSLVRRIFKPEDWSAYANLLGRTLGEALVEPHRSYLPHVRAIRQVAQIKAMAHLTGGGFQDNIPRVLPAGLGAVINRAVWPVPPLFQLIERQGAVDHDEMYRVFNMGIGMVVMVAPGDVDKALEALHGEAYIVGEVIAQQGEERVLLR